MDNAEEANLAEKLAGTFIVFDGPDGCGKSTQINMLAEHLRSLGGQVEVVADPGSTPMGEKIRELLLLRREVPLGAMCEMMLFMASRAELVDERVRPALAQGKIVLCDRFISSTVAYQGALGVDVRTIIEVANVAVGGVWPDITVILDLPSQQGLDRTTKRREGTDVEADRMETRTLEYHQAVRERFASLCKDYPGQVSYVSAGGDVQKVFADVLAELGTFGEFEE